MEIHNHFCPICDALVGFATRLRCPDGRSEDHEVDPCNLCWEDFREMEKEGDKKIFREEIAATYPPFLLAPLPSLDCLLAVVSDQFFARFNPIGDAPVEQKSYF